MAKKTSEVNTTIDTITNIVNVGLIFLGATLISLGTFYWMQTDYDYLITIGVYMIIGGVIGIIIGLIGFIKHGQIVRRMKRQAKENLNY